MKLKVFLKISFVSALARALGAFLAFLSTVVIARFMPPSEAGLYFLAFSIVSILAVFVRLGLDSTTIKMVGVYSNSKDFGLTDKFIHVALLITFLSSLLGFFSLNLSSDFLSTYIFAIPELAGVLNSMSPFVVFCALMTIVSFVYQGLSKTVISVLFLNVLINLFLILGVVTFDSNTAISASNVLVIASAICAILGYGGVRHYVGKYKNKKIGVDKSVPIKSVFNSCFPLWVFTTVTQLIQWSGQIFLGLWAEPYDVSQFSVAQRASMLAAFILTSVNLVVAPKFAQLFSTKQYDQLEQLALMSTRFVALIAIPILLLMLIFPSYLLLLFGDEYNDAVLLLQILACGQFINAITGAVCHLLSMSGHENDLRNSSLLSGVVVLVGSIVLVPNYGGVGAAISVSLGVILQNLLAAYFVKIRLNINTFRLFKL